MAAAVPALTTTDLSRTPAPDVWAAVATARARPGVPGLIPVKRSMSNLGDNLANCAPYGAESVQEPFAAHRHDAILAPALTSNSSLTVLGSTTFMAQGMLTGILFHTRHLAREPEHTRRST